MAAHGDGIATTLEYDYDAFISYRGKDARHVARWLRRQLIQYRVPAELLATAARRPLKVYLDEMYERATEDFFTRTITPNLEKSRYLIVIGTPGALERRDDD